MDVPLYISYSAILCGSLVKTILNIVNYIGRAVIPFEGIPGKDLVSVEVAGKGSHNVSVSELELLTFVGPLPADFDSMA